MFIEVTCLSLKYRFIVSLAVIQNHEYMTVASHLIEYMCVTPKPGKSLFSNACVETLYSISNPLIIVGRVLAFSSMLLGVKFVNHPELYLRENFLPLEIWCQFTINIMDECITIRVQINYFPNSFDLNLVIFRFLHHLNRYNSSGAWICYHEPAVKKRFSSLFLFRSSDSFLRSLICTDFSQYFWISIAN